MFGAFRKEKPGKIVMENKNTDKEIPWEVESQARKDVLGSDDDLSLRMATPEQIESIKFMVVDEMNRRLHEKQLQQELEDGDEE